MGVDPHSIRARALTTEEIVLLLKSEAAAIDQSRDIPVAFFCAITGNLADWALASLPRIGSGDAHSTENERMLIHQIKGLVNALADIY